MLDDVLRQSGGSLTNEERKWADALLHPPGRKPERKKSTGGCGTARNRAA
jgi:hypothetical protein